jgi:hypothetical protein
MATPQDKLQSIAGLFDPPPAPAQQAPSNPHGAYDAETSGRWSLADADKVKDWYRQTYGRELPVTAFGQSSTHDRMGLDHSDAMDVGVNLAYALARQGRGVWMLDWKSLPEQFRVKLPRMTAEVADMVELEGEYYHRAGMRMAVDALDARYGQKPKDEG